VHGFTLLAGPAAGITGEIVMGVRKFRDARHGRPRWGSREDAENRRSLSGGHGRLKEQVQLRVGVRQMLAPLGPGLRPERLTGFEPLLPP